MEKNEKVLSFKSYFESIARTKKVWVWLIGLVNQKKWRGLMWWRYGTILFTMAVELAEPGVVGIIIQDIATGRTDRLIYLFSAIVVLEIVGRVARWKSTIAHEWIWSINTESFAVGMTKRFFEKSQSQHKEESDLNHESLDKTRDKAQDLMTGKSTDMFETICLMVMALVYLTFLSLTAGIAMFVIAVIHIMWSAYNNWRAEVVCEEIDNEFRALNRYLAARWQNVERVTTSAKREREIRIISERSREICNRDRAFWLWENSSSTLREGLTSLGVITVFALMVHGVILSGGKEAGLLFPIWIWTSAIRGSLWRFGWLEREIRKHMPRIRATMSVLEKPTHVSDSPTATDLVPNGGVKLAFERITHSYPKGEPVLRDVSFEVGKGEIVALVGPSGSGKSTLEALAMRFMDPDSGRIVVNGQDLREIKVDSWMRAVGFIPQHSQIPDGTVRDNPLYGLQVEELAGKDWEAELQNLLAKLRIDFGKRPVGENPLDIVVGRDGVKLSGGQAQRLMIGAAVLKKPRFMIIDEATSSLDSTTEKAVLLGLDELLKGVGTLVIAHRLSTVRRANKIVVLSGGKIESVANSFRELHDQSPTFRRMADDQDLEIE